MERLRERGKMIEERHREVQCCLKMEAGHAPRHLRGLQKPAGEGKGILPWNLWKET